MLKQRILTAAALLLGLLAAIFYLPPPYWAGLMALVAAVAAWEWGGLAGLKMPGRLVFGGLQLLLCGLLMHTGVPLDDFGSGGVMPLLLCAAALFWCLIVPSWLWRRWRLNQSAWGRGLLLFLGIGLILATWVAFVGLRALHPGLLLWTLGIAWVSDISAYFAGRGFGGRKLAPEISPGKTWAGVYGALAGVLLYGLLSLVMYDAPWGYAILLLPLLLLTILGILGDLFESLLKRQAGIKDSGNLLPGHGGVLDRVDSLLAVLPCAALIAYAAYAVLVAIMRNIGSLGR
ncbi:MAG: phosphatidate cytidylyltransferase [Zoogloeaceae bacterium]|jgi:phosphatidate cytidylyltransferase|nr:phosphatidate cytidylyltransferase [Zoogloeaceae bacterium]